MAGGHLPEGFRSDFLECNGVKLHVVHNGRAYDGAPIGDGRRPLLCLHGFPEFWICWEEVARCLGDDYLLVLPDQRGCNLSEAPADAEQYTAKVLVADVVELAGRMFGRRKFYLAGHDFGASVAYALVFSLPRAVERLVIVNGAHPVCLQEALIDDPAQVAASEYFHTVRRDGAGERAAADDFRESFAGLERHSRHPWITDEVKQRFREAWQGPERLDAMFNWYRSSPIVVPVAGEPPPEAPLYGAPADAFRVTVPHLLVWGLDDSALLPGARKRLPEFCDELTVREVPGADHWILHTHAEQVAGFVREFLGS